MKKFTERKSIFGIPFDGFSIDDTIDLAIATIENREKVIYADLNASSVLLINENSEMSHFFRSADILNIDGQGIVLACRLINGVKVPRTTGCDLMLKLIEEASVNNLSCYFLGAKQVVLEQLLAKVSINYGKSVIAGARNGYFDKEDEELIVADINRSGAHILFLGMTSPKKEQFLSDNFQNLSTLFNMGVGGSFDVHAGLVKRAPLFMQKIGLEWFYRVLQEPKRMWKRYLTVNSKFLILLLNGIFNRNRTY
jgi:N-acetylglucosaminyldiphosphoundecaprenol N-acetyl-beta-D-mannosaminyltransferase